MGAYSDKQRGAVLYARFRLVKANLFIIWNGRVSVSPAARVALLPDRPRITTLAIGSLLSLAMAM